MQSKKKDVNFSNGKEKPEPDRVEIHNVQINMQKMKQNTQKAIRTHPERAHVQIFITKRGNKSGYNLKMFTSERYCVIMNPQKEIQ